jgi:hypothetical protein
MSLNHHQRHQLHRIESGLLRSDPHLSAMMTVFARLSADQGTPTWEQLPARPDRAGSGRPIARAVAVLAATIGLLLTAARALLTPVMAGDRAGPRQERTSKPAPVRKPEADPIRRLALIEPGPAHSGGPDRDRKPDPRGARKHRSFGWKDSCRTGVVSPHPPATRPPWRVGWSCPGDKGGGRGPRCCYGRAGGQR